MWPYFFNIVAKYDYGTTKFPVRVVRDSIMVQYNKADEFMSNKGRILLSFNGGSIIVHVVRSCYVADGSVKL